MQTQPGTNKILSYRHPLDQGQAPEWACGWGQDRFGIWVEISIADIVQKLRWIPPGQFAMGSPENETGRYDDEGPQHPVTLSQGYWLFDTPVTQALWQAVMGDNPSKYRSPRRPVENVCWHDAKTFIERINAMIPGLNLDLPTEAQWEYACRAMTQTATYIGELKILGERNAPQLDQIAWYGGNSGQGYELEEGYDSREWPEKQYNHNKAGSREVEQKRPNDWGLYDMLGNVWEWCRDGLRDYQARAEQDPVGPEEKESSRVLRGGSWGSVARDLRAAYRDGSHPESRFDVIGFRCARVQAGARSQSLLRYGQGSAAERRPDRGAT